MAEPYPPVITGQARVVDEEFFRSEIANLPAWIESQTGTRINEIPAEKAHQIHQAFEMRLADNNMVMGHVRIPTMFRLLDEVLAENVPEYTAGVRYRNMMDITALADVMEPGSPNFRDNPYNDTLARVQGMLTQENAARVPVSPYDLRFLSRSEATGNEPLVIRLADVRGLVDTTGIPDFETLSYNRGLVDVVNMWHAKPVNGKFQRLSAPSVGMTRQPEPERSAAPTGQTGSVVPAAQPGGNNNVVYPKLIAGQDRIVNEEFFRSEIENLPEWVSERTGEDFSPVTVKQARVLHRKFEEKLRENNRSLDRTRVPSLYKFLDEVFAENVPGYEAGVRYAHMTDITAVDDVMKPGSPNFRDNPYNETLARVQDMLSDGADARVPVSPYDTRFTYRQVVMDQGVTALAVPMSDVRALAPETEEGGVRVPDFNAMAGSRAPEMAMIPVVTADRVDDRHKKVGKFYNPEAGDTTLEQVLAPYLTEAEQRSLSGWARDLDVSSLTAEDLDKIDGLVGYLADSGIDYTVTRDRNEGQIQVSLPGRGMDIRLIDLDSPDDNGSHPYIGRVYKRGSILRLVEANGTKTKVPTPSTEQLIDLIRFSSGEPVERFDGKLVGEVGTVEYGERNLAPDGTYDWPGNRTELSYHRPRSSSKSLNRYAFTGTLDIGVGTAAGSDPVDPSVFDRRSAIGSLAAAVTSARDNVTALLDVEGLIEDFQAHGDDEGWVPASTGDERLDALRDDYVALLRGETGDLLDASEFVTAPDDDMPLAERLESTWSTGDLDTDDAVEKVRAHASRVPDAFIGDLAVDREEIEQLDIEFSDLRRDMKNRSTKNSGLFTFNDVKVAYEENEAVFREETSDLQDTRINPAMLGIYMDTDSSPVRTHKNLAYLMRLTELTSDNFIGNETFNRSIGDALINFDPERSEGDMREHDNEDIRYFGELIAGEIERTGATVTQLDIDEQGLVQWKARPVIGERGDGEGHEEISGTIGQIFPRDDKNFGAIITNYAESENTMIVPGYEAYVVPQKIGENKTLEERTRLRGYREVIGDSIKDSVFVALNGSRNMYSDPTGLNGALRRLYDNRYPADFLENETDGLGAEWTEAIIRTEGLRVKYPKKFAEEATAMAYLRENKNGEVDLRNDNGRSGLVLSGNRNMSQLDSAAGAGIFDPVMTGVAGNQGTVRFLIPSAQIGDNGEIIKGDPADRVPVAAHPDAAKMIYDPHDRQNMSLSNIMQAIGVVPRTRTAFAQVGGYNFEDGVLISKRFSEENQILRADGSKGPVKEGDKLSDFHGNKGLVSIVVDPNMSDEEAEARGILQAVQLFRANPDLDQVMSPSSGTGRFNGGSAREMIENTDLKESLWVPTTADNPEAVINEDGIPVVEVPNGISGVNTMILHHTADRKTNVYDDAAVAEGKGRRASAQVGWALDSQGCKEVFRYFYGTNERNLESVGDYLNVLGYRLSDTGKITVAGDDIDTMTDLDTTHIIHMPEPGSRPVSAATLQRNAFAREISTRGGVMEVPFEMTLPSGAKTPKAPDFEVSGRYLLPVLPASLRSGRELDDGEMTYHDYTQRYMAIYAGALNYDAAKAKLDAPGQAGQQAKSDLEKATKQIERSYQAITSDVMARKVAGKHNMFKESVMGHRLPNSATAVWSNGPDLDLDTVAMNSRMAVDLGVLDPETGGMKNDGYVMIWRDPVLRDGGVRYLRVVIDEDVTGIRVNPAIVESFDGDFDGDSVAVVGNLPHAAHVECLDKLTMEANLLDKGKCGLDDTYPLGIHTGLDIASTCEAIPELGEAFEELRVRANRIETDWRNGDIDDVQRRDARKEALADLNVLCHRGFTENPNPVALRFGDVKDHMVSVMEVVETKAKGNGKKVAMYAQCFAAELADSSLDISAMTSDEMKAAEWIDKVLPDTEKKAELDLGSQLATALKTQYTGVAGARSQKAVMLLRAVEMMTEATESGYVSTQGMLQAKHDPEDAKYRADIIRGPLVDHWNGFKLDIEMNEETGKLVFKPAKTQDGEYILASKQEWIDQFRAINSDDAMNVNVGENILEAIAEELSMTGADGIPRMKYMDLRAYEDSASNKKVAGIEDNRCEVDALPLDKLSYMPGEDTLKNLVEEHPEGVDLFAGATEVFAPRSFAVAREREAQADFTDPESGQEFESKSVRNKTSSRDFDPAVKASKKTGLRFGEGAGLRERICDEVDAQQAEQAEAEQVGMVM